jgi:methionyl-tRNA formyltransferase
MVVVAYGLILPKEVLTAPKYGCINVHASLLPRWRGAAPIERAILAGDKETGVTIMQMDEGLDTGNMLYSQTLPITARDNRQTIETALAELGANTLLFVLNNLSTLLPTSTPQQESLSTYAPKMQKQEALINWNSNAEHISRQVRAGIGRYPAYTLLANERIRIIDGTVSNDRADQPPGTILCASRDLLRVACLENSFDIKTLQVPGRTPVSVEAFMNSHQQSFQPGKVFQSTEPGVV